MNRFLLILLTLIACAWDASAHTRSQSFSAWSVDGNVLSGVYQVDAYRATQLSEVPKDLSLLLREHLEPRVTAMQNGTVCKRTRFQALSAPRGDLRVEFQFACAKPISEKPALLNIGGFFDVSISHVHYARVTYGDGRIDEVILTKGSHALSVGGAAASAAHSFVSLLVLGFEHVISGVDHIAFLIALMMLAGSLRQTVWAVTGFTLGHSLTLALVFLGALEPNVTMIESLIGFTVAWAAGDALARVRNTPLWLGLAGAIAIGVFGIAAMLGLMGKASWVVMLGLAVFAGCMTLLRGYEGRRIATAIATVFGLAHGAGFAGPLLALKIEPGDMVWTLLAFNLGVEAGQLFAVALVAGGLWTVRHYRLPVPPLAFDAVASVLFSLGIFWFVARAIG